MSRPENKKLVIRKIEWEPRKFSASIVIGDKEHHVWVSASEDLSGYGFSFARHTAPRDEKRRNVRASR